MTGKSSAIIWAVWMGCNTARRLAAEWGITVESATQRLLGARRSGYLRKHSRTRGGCIRYKVARLEVGMTA